MRSNFMFPSGDFGKFDSSAFIFNTIGIKVSNLPVYIDLRLYIDGILINSINEFSCLQPGEVCEITSKSSPLLKRFNSTPNQVIVAHCWDDKNEVGYLHMDGQMIIRHRDSGSYGSVLYDSFPVNDTGKLGAPLVLLDHKVWVSADLQTYIVFMNAFEINDQLVPSEAINIKIFDENGVSLSELQLTSSVGGVIVFDVNKNLHGLVQLSSEPKFLNIVARGSNSPTAIWSAITHRQTGSVSIEHSLPPMYYVSGHWDRIRNEAINF